MAKHVDPYLVNRKREHLDNLSKIDKGEFNSCKMYNDPRSHRESILMEIIPLGDTIIRPNLRITQDVSHENSGWDDQYLGGIVDEKFKSEAISHRIENATKDFPLGSLAEDSASIKKRIFRHLSDDCASKLSKAEKEIGMTNKITDALIRIIEIAAVSWLSANLNTCHRAQDASRSQAGNVAYSTTIEMAVTSKRGRYKKTKCKVRTHLAIRHPSNF